MKKYVYNLARIGGFIGLLLFGIFYSQVGVKASGLVDLNPVDGVVSIPEYENSSMFICGSGTDSNNQFSLDNVSSSELFSLSSDDNGNYYRIFYHYVLNPAVGNLVFTGGNSYTRCFFIDNLDSENPYDINTFPFMDGYVGGLTNPDNLIIPDSDNNYYLFAGWLNLSNLTDLSISSSSVVWTGSQSNFGITPQVYSVVSNGSENQSLTVSWNSGNWSQLGFAQVIFNEFQTSSNDYILYYGDNPYYQAIGQESALPVVYDVCDSWDSEHPFSLELRKNPYSSSDWISLDSYTLSSCSGTLLLNDISATTELSETAKLVIYNGETTIAESNEFLYVAYTPLSVDNNSFIHYYYPNGLYINTSGGNGTTTINFAYDVCADDNFASSTFYLKNLDSGNTGVSFTPIQCNAAASLELPYTENLNLSFPATISYQRNSVEYLSSKIFTVSFYSQPKIIQKTDKTSLWGVSAHDRACTTEEWAESESWISFFPSSCKIKYSFWVIVANFANILDDSVSWGINSLINLFPLNIPTNILKSWNDSESASLISSLSPLDVVNENNEITGTLPASWFGSSTSVVILGKSTMTGGNNPDALSLFASIKLLSVWFQWTLFAFGFILWGRSVYKDLTSEVHNDEKI